MRSPLLARAWNATLATVIAVSVVAQLVIVLRGQHVLVADGPLPPAGTRVIRFFSYFTVQSNVFVAVTCGWLALRPDTDHPLWRVLRLDALVGITITGLIYVTLLRPLVDLHGVPALTDTAFHYVAPIMAVVGWLAFGPRGRITDGVLGRSLVWPAAYVLYTLAHGAASAWYPYPFIDVTAIGYVPALRNGVGIAVLILGVGALYRWLDAALSRRWTASSVTSSS